MNDSYIASEYKRLHEANKFSGACLEKYLPEIKKLITEYDCKSVLDYGCGKASHHKKNRLAQEVKLYDPYYEPYSEKPKGGFDMVICTDVMEHIPENEVGKTLAALLDYTNKVLFLSISTKLAKKTFTNGKNVHLTVKPREWWEAMLSTAKDIKIVRHYT